MPFWGICLRAELESRPDVWPIARTFKSEASALSATSVLQRIVRTELRSDYAGTECSPWRQYWIEGNGQEQGIVYRFDAIVAPAPAAFAEAITAGKKKGKKAEKKGKKKTTKKGKAPASSRAAVPSSKRGKPRGR